jgi:Domain of unknown function (DUF397)
MTAKWRKSSHSEGSQDGACVEVADLGPGLVGLRDSKNPALPHLSITPTAFGRLVRQIKAQ